jgi:hypothetical protein
MEVAPSKTPSKSYKLDVRPYLISLDDLVKTMA